VLTTACYNYIKLVEVLLKDSQVNPAANKNEGKRVKITLSSVVYSPLYLLHNHLTDEVICSLDSQQLETAIKNKNWNRQSAFLYACGKGNNKVVKQMTDKKL
jgi:hypothetical protein